MKKRWYRNKWAKGILVALGIISVEAAAVSAGMVIGIASMGIYPFDSGTYTESRSFANEVYRSSGDILHAVQNAGFLGDGQGVIDLQEVFSEEPISYEDTSGLAYSVKDLEEWAESGWGNEDTENILICTKKDGGEEYLYFDEFNDKIRSGELKIQINGTIDGYGADQAVEYASTEDYEAAREAAEFDLEEELLEWLRNRDFMYDTGISDSYYSACVVDKDGEIVYTDVKNFSDYAFPEKYHPQDADSILEVLNEEPQWQGRIYDAYDALTDALNQAALAVQSRATLEETYGEGLTNLNYVFVDNGADKVYTNVENLKDTDYDSVWKRIDQDAASHVILTPEEGGTNLNTAINSLQDWKNLAEGYSTDKGDYLFAIWTDENFEIPDVLAENQENYEKYAGWLTPILICGLFSIVLLAVCVGFLTAGAGRANEGEEIRLNFFDRWFTEIAALLVVGIWLAGTTSVLNIITWSLEVDTLGYFTIFNILGLWTGIWFFIGWLSLVRRIKAGALWKNSFTRCFILAAGKLLKKGWALLKEIVELFAVNTSSRLKMALIFGGFCFFQFVVCGMIFAGGAWILILVLGAADAAGLVYLLRKARGREEILKGLKEITDGNLQYKIPLDRLTGEQKTIAEYINRIGDGLDAAVENSVKNERMKTELITNVSHDIKTPLTSIINYIDLLKREHPTDPKICGYLDILEEKAQRLKHLTEDVVEASKASTGNISLEMADLNFVELVHQVIGEFEEKFQEKNLTLMMHFEEDEAIICADGRRMWRVLENVFGNVAKYAMENTRVYAEIKVKNQKVIFSLKNISAQPLNISADELTERFIRGDVSRNTEGSGLGLSIAKSLAELQGGEFRLYLDGDLFKVTIVFQVKDK